MAENGGSPWVLLPCESKLLHLAQALAEADSCRSSDLAVLRILRAHPFVEVKGRPGGSPPRDFGDGLGICSEEHFRLNIRTFNQWLKSKDGKVFAKQAGGPSDDGIYTISALLRRCMPRGFSRFTFEAFPEEEVLVRGFRKFTGLNADDEDEESGATEHTENFYFEAGRVPERFAVTTKSNGENGKFSVRSVGGHQLLFAGSKNTCIAWRSELDVTVIQPSSDPTIPGPLIAAAVQTYWRGWEVDTRGRFADVVNRKCWTLMLEHNCAHHEHVFPIDRDYVEFVAILDRSGLPLPQTQAFDLFDEFHLPRVRCDANLPMHVFPERLHAERTAVDREGAVLYLETDSGQPVGLVKVKSSFYVKARRTRQTFWSAVVDPLLKGQDLGGDRNIGWTAADRRLRSGMKTLHHVDGCEEHGQEWADAAVGFVHWWHARYDALRPNERKEFAKAAKSKFGSLYRDYCKENGLPGGQN